MFVFVIDFTMFEPFISHSLETWELSFTKANNYRVLGEPFGMLTSAPLGTNRIVLLPLTTTRFLSWISNVSPQNTTMYPSLSIKPLTLIFLLVREYGGLHHS